MVHLRARRLLRAIAAQQPQQADMMTPICDRNTRHAAAVFRALVTQSSLAPLWHCPQYFDTAGFEKRGLQVRPRGHLPKGPPAQGATCPRAGPDHPMEHHPVDNLTKQRFLVLWTRRRFLVV